jgi:hypothetical protein
VRKPRVPCGPDAPSSRRFFGREPGNPNFKPCHPERSEASAERSRKLALSEVEGDPMFLNDTTCSDRNLLHGVLRARTSDHYELCHSEVTDANYKESAFPYT